MAEDAEAAPGVHGEQQVPLTDRAKPCQPEEAVPALSISAETQLGVTANTPAENQLKMPVVSPISPNKATTDAPAAAPVDLSPELVTPPNNAMTDLSIEAFLECPSDLFNSRTEDTAGILSEGALGVSPDSHMFPIQARTEISPQMSLGFPSDPTNAQIDKMGGRPPGISLEPLSESINFLEAMAGIPPGGSLKAPSDAGNPQMEGMVDTLSKIPLQSPFHSFDPQVENLGELPSGVFIEPPSNSPIASAEAMAGTSHDIPVGLTFNSHYPGPSVSGPGGLEDAQNGIANGGLATMDGAAMNDEEDSDEEELFVRQPGEVKVVNNCIDLTRETQVESDTRAARVHARQSNTEPGSAEDSEPEIKQEDDVGSDSHDSDSEYREDSDDEITGGEESARRRPKNKRASRKSKKRESDLPDNIDDAQDKFDMLSAEEAILARRQDNNSLKPGQAERLEEVGQLIASLKERIQELTATPVGARSSGAQVGDGMASSHSQEITSESLPTAAAAPSSSTARKRKAPAQPKSRATKKKPRAPGTSATRRKKGNAAKEGAELILELLQNQDPIAAGQDMADLPKLDGFSATTIKDQEKQFRELCSKYPDADKRQIRGDMVMLAKARIALSRRYKVLGETFLIRGMKTPLFPYQFVGTGWMVGRELSSEGPQGGLLADAMGLGKTLETLACIAGNPPTEEDQRNGLRTTLLVVPSNVVGQWIAEIYKHCDGISVSHYRKSDVIHQAAREYSPIWITSYEELSLHYPSDDKIRKYEQHPGLTPEECEGLRPKYLGPLFSISFYRIVLDEADRIKNHKSQRMKACVELAAKYRWALSGTPVHNRTTEIFPYMCLLRAPGSSTLGEFTAKYLRKSKVGANDGEALALLLKQTMLKRTQHTKFFGHGLLDLPRPHVLDPIMVDLSREETLIYRRVEGILRRLVSAQLRMAKPSKRQNRQNRKRTVKKSWLIEVLRLRQAVFHPFLLETLMKDLFEAEDIKWLISELSKVQTRTPFINQIGLWCEKQLQVQKIQKGGEKPKHEGLTASFDMIRQLERVGKHNDWKENAKDLCRRCGFVPGDPFQPECGHVFCRSCIESYAAEESGTKKKLGCRPCNTLMSNIRKSLPPPPAREIEQVGLWSGPSTMKPRGRGDDVNGIQPTTQNTSTFLADSDREQPNMLMPSAKMIILTSMLLDWCRLYPEDKIIVFTLFVDGGRIIGRMLQDANIDFLYYFGSMSHAEKYQAIQDFTEKKDIRVLVASMQCSAQALNLACANRVIVLDIWWNAALEQQAFGRVYRMGQVKETYMGRILVKNTVDMRLAQLQLAKLKTIAGTIKEHDSSDVTLSAEDIASLLGRVVRDEDGNIIDIESDYDDEDDLKADDADWANEADGSGGFSGEWDQETMMGDDHQRNFENPQGFVFE